MDRISDFCTRIRNAVMVRKNQVDIPHSKLKEGIAKQLKKYGYIRDYKTASSSSGSLMRLYLKYNVKGAAITRIERLSKPSRRSYVKAANIPSVCSGYGLVVLSTKKVF